MKIFKNMFVVLLCASLFGLAGLTGCKTEDDSPAYYTVTFDTDGGSTAPEAQTVESGKTAIKPDDPTKDEYGFAGWYNGEAAFDFSTAITADITLKAKWNINIYTVTFDTDGGSTAPESQTVESGNTVTKPEDPTKDEYSFGGWYYGESEFDFTTPVTADIELKAKWLLFTGTAYTVNDDGTVCFGDFPQTIKADDVTIDENKTVEQGDYTYYKGSDGFWYAKQADINDDNTEKYYKVEPIKWKVIDESYDIDGENGTATGKLLFAENVVVACAYYDYHDVNRTISEATVYPNNYKESRVRAYLNGLSYTKKASASTDVENDSTFNGKGFLNTAFTSILQTGIVTTEVNNDATTTQYSTGSYACDNTDDKIFLLSYSEVTTYYTKKPARIRETTDFAQATGAYQSDNEGEGGRWLQRSPNNLPGNSYSTYFVNETGYADNYNKVDLTNYGVVPALCIAN